MTNLWVIGTRNIIYLGLLGWRGKSLRTLIVRETSLTLPKVPLSHLVLLSRVILLLDLRKAAASSLELERRLPGLWKILVLLLASWLKNLRWNWWYWSPPSNCFNLLHLQVFDGLFPCLLTESLVLLIDIQNQFLDVIAGSLVLVEVLRTDAEMQRLIRFFLPRTLFESGSFSPQSQFHNLLKLIIIDSLATNLYYPFHIAPLGSNQPPGHLELFVIVNLDIESACVFNIFILLLLLLLLKCLLVLLRLLLSRNIVWVLLINVLVWELSNVGASLVLHISLIPVILMAVIKRMLRHVFLINR